MSATELFLSHPLVLALGWTLLHFLWQGALAALLFAATRAALRKSASNTRYLAACVALVLLAACPIATFSYLTRPADTPAIPVLATPALVRETILTLPVEAAQLPAISTPTARTSVANQISDRLQRTLPWLVSGWLTIVCLLSVRLLVGYARVHRIKTEAHEALGEFWEEKLLRLAEQIRVSRPVRLCQSALVEVPTVIGWLRPVILFPASAVIGLPTAQLEAILAHELAHIRRHDYLVNLLQNVVETFLFYHPAVWWVSRQVSQERELCCDDVTVMVCGDRIAYAKALAALEELRCGTPALALAASGGPLVRRIRRLLGVPAEPSRGGWWLAGAFVLLALAALVVASRGSLIEADGVGLPKTQNPQSNLAPGLSDFVEQANYVRAVQGELARTIAQIDGIAAARVNIVRPESRLLIDPIPRTIASVSVKPQENGSLSANAINAIRFLVANSVEELKPNDVSVKDSAGNVLAEVRPEDHSTNAAPVAAKPSDDQRQAVSVLVLDARLLIELGKLDEAETKLEEVTKQDPDHAAAKYYLDVITNTRRAQEHRKREVRESRPLLHPTNPPRRADPNYPVQRDQPPQPSRFAHTNLVYTSAARERIQQKLDSIILDEVTYDGVPLNEVVKDLNQRARKLSPPGVNFIIMSSIDVPPPTPSTESPSKRGPLEAELPPSGRIDLNKAVIRIVPPLRNVRFRDVIEAISKAADKPLKCSVEDYAVFFTPGSPPSAESGSNSPLFPESRERSAGSLPAPSSQFVPERRADKLSALPLESTVTDNLNTSNRTATLVRDSRLLIELGKLDEAETKLEEALKLEPENPTAQSYLKFIREIRVSTKSQVEAILKQALADFENGVPSTNRQDQAQWQDGSPARRAILEKLDTIVLDQVFYDDTPLTEVIRDLVVRVQQLDPEGHGIDFIVPYRVENPTTLATEPNPASKAVVRINPPLRNVKLRDVIEAVTKAANPSLRYQIDDYGVVITHRTADPPRLFTRTFKVDPNTFTKNLSNILNDQMLGASANRRRDLQNLMTNLNDSVREFFVLAGVDFPNSAVYSGSGLSSGSVGSAPAIASETSLSGRKAVFFNDRTGVLYARATLEELEVMEHALQTLNSAPPQVMIETKFVEISDADSRTLGFDWFLGNLATGVPAGPSGTTNAPERAVTGVQSDPQFRGLFPGIPPPAEESKLDEKKGATNSPAAATVTGILTEAQYRVILRALNQRSGVQVLASPSVTTLSGRQARVEMTESKKITVGMQTNSSPTQARTTTPNAYFVRDFALGPSVDLIPTVLDDGRSIRMVISASTAQFLGYDDPGPFISKSADQAPITAVLPLPRFRLREVTGTATLWDGQTVVMGPFASRDVADPSAKVPVLGDIPLLGRLFRSESASKTNKHLILFVTATIVDPAGNRMHMPEP